MQLIKYRDAGMSTYTYFWKNNDQKICSPYFNSEVEAQEWLNKHTIDINNCEAD